MNSLFRCHGFRFVAACSFIFSVSNGNIGIATDGHDNQPESTEETTVEFRLSDSEGVMDGVPNCRCGISHDPGHPAKPGRKLPGDIDRSGCPPKRYQMSDCCRAGNPYRVAAWAVPSISPKYSAWFVGGGKVFGGDGCCEPKGTWGMDYHGWLKPRRVWLKWTNGRHQGGTGAYQTDGHTGPLHGE